MVPGSPWLSWPAAVGALAGAALMAVARVPGIGRICLVLLTGGAVAVPATLGFDGAGALAERAVAAAGRYPASLAGIVAGQCAAALIGLGPGIGLRREWEVERMGRKASFPRASRARIRWRGYCAAGRASVGRWRGTASGISAVRNTRGALRMRMRDRPMGAAGSAVRRRRQASAHGPACEQGLLEFRHRKSVAPHNGGLCPARASDYLDRMVGADFTPKPAGTGSLGLELEGDMQCL